MTNIQILNPIKSIKSILTLTTASFALFAGEALLAPQAAFADDCLLDTNNNGTADDGDDTDSNADSGGEDFSPVSYTHLTLPTTPYV